VDFSKLAKKHGIWTEENLAFGDKKKSITFIKMPGYDAGDDKNASIAECLTGIFGVRKAGAKAWPLEGEPPRFQGEFEAIHPLHETFLTNDSWEDKDITESERPRVLPRLSEDRTKPLKEITLVELRKLDFLFCE